MRLFRLADLFEHKYGIGSVVKTAATPPAEVLARVKGDILNNYRHWVMGKYRALKILGEHGEPYAKALYNAYNDLVANIDTYSPVQLFNRVNKILNAIKEMKADPQGYRQSIHDSVEVTRESDKNYREQLKGGFETNLKNISFGLEKAAKILRAFAPGEEILGGAVEPQRKALSKEKLRMFMITPAAQFYKLDDIDVMQRILQYPETREKLTTLINSIDRGHVPADGPEVMSEAQSIRKMLDAQKQTNLPALEQTPEKPAPNVSLFDEEEENPE